MRGLLLLLVVVAAVAIPRPVAAQSGWVSWGMVTCSSSNASYPCARLTDGNTTSLEWRPGVSDGPSWIRLDLGDDYLISGVRRAAINSANYAWNDVTFQSCTDGTYTSCTTQWTGAFPAATDWTIGARFAHVNARYWQVVLQHNFAVRGYELQVYVGTYDTATATATVTSTDTAVPTDTPTPTPTNTSAPAATNTPLPTATIGAVDGIPFSEISLHPSRWFFCSLTSIATDYSCRALDWIHGESRSTQFGWLLETEGGDGLRTVQAHLIPPMQAWDGTPIEVTAMMWLCTLRYHREYQNRDNTTGVVVVQKYHSDVTETVINGSLVLTNLGTLGGVSVYSDPTGVWYAGNPVTDYPGMELSLLSTVAGEGAYVDARCNVEDAVGYPDAPVTPGPTSTPTPTVDPATITPQVEDTATVQPTTGMGTPWATPEPWAQAGGLSTPEIWAVGTTLVPVALVPAATWGAGDPLLQRTPLAALPTREFVVGISTPTTSCLFDMPALGPWGGQEVFSMTVPLFEFPEFSLCTEEYDFDFIFLGWNLGLLLTVSVSVMAFGLLWSIIKR